MRSCGRWGAGHRGVLVAWVVAVTSLGFGQVAPSAPDARLATALDDIAPTAAVAGLLAATAGHPGLRAATALAEAADLRLDAVRQPLTLAARFEATRRSVEPARQPLPDPSGDAFAIDASSDTLALSLVLRPFLAGDLADLGDQRRVEIERAAIALRETRAQVEAQALEAAFGLWLADFGVGTAAAAEALAELAESAAQRRAEVGGANLVEVGDAERARREAAATARDARAQRDLAAARLRSLVGDVTPLAPVELDAVVGVPPDLLRAVLDVALAEVGVRSAERGLLPTVEAGYTWLHDDGGSLTLGLENRTWQPAVSYQTAGAAGASAGAGGAAGQVPPENLPTVRGSLNVSVAWTLSPGDALETEAVRRQLDAAIAGLAAAHDRARLTQRGLEVAIAAATDREALARLDLGLRALERDAADDRFAAGAIGELERLSAHLAWHRAAVAYAAARVERAGAILDTYVTNAIPLSEVLP